MSGLKPPMPIMIKSPFSRLVMLIRFNPSARLFSSASFLGSVIKVGVSLPPEGVGASGEKGHRSAERRVSGGRACVDLND